MKKILLVSAGDIAAGGVVGYLLKLLQYFPDKEEYQFLWYAPGKIVDPMTHDQIRKLNVTLIVSDYDVQDKDVRKKWRFMHRELSKLIQEQKPDVIHVNTGNLLAQIHALQAARENNVPVRIAHSHGAYPLPKQLPKKLYYSFLNSQVCKNATVKLTCSDVAGVSLFGEKNAKDAVFIKNGINTQQFRFSAENREKLRNEAGLDDRYIIGHVGTFDDNKNQRFLIDIIKKLESSAKGKYGLILIGNGYTFDDLKAYAEEQGLSDIVRFLGRRDNVNEWMSAFDCFAMPSKREGLPFVCVEAQCAGLPCVISDAVTREVKLTEYVSFLDINNGIDEWCSKLTDVSAITVDRAESAEYVKKCGFDIHDNVSQIISFYNSSASE